MTPQRFNLVKNIEFKKSDEIGKKFDLTRKNPVGAINQEILTELLVLIGSGKVKSNPSNKVKAKIDFITKRKGIFNYHLNDSQLKSLTEMELIDKFDI